MLETDISLLIVGDRFLHLFNASDRKVFSTIDWIYFVHLLHLIWQTRYLNLPILSHFKAIFIQLSGQSGDH